MNKTGTIHFIGIGGVGMSGLAKVFNSRGYDVRGSDIKKTKVTDRLELSGIRVNRSHSAENIEGVDYIVYSSCIRENNVELREARRRGTPILRRIEALNMLICDKELVAVSGAHGKTTTSALAAYLLIKGGLDPTVFIGADVDFLEGNARCGKGDLVLTEADESDGSFLLLNPLYTISTNIDREHMDYYSNMGNLIASYRRFIENTKGEGCAFICLDDNNLKAIINKSTRTIKTYGVSEDADIKAADIELLGLNGSRFNLIFNGKLLGGIELSIIGMHNVLNSLAAIGLAMHLGVDFSIIQHIIGNFKGADRRFKINSLDSEVLLIDDYAHHPTEIKATLKALEGSGKRIIVVFQPHRYSRTRYLREEFGSCFELADHLVITDIYSAYEEPIDSVSAGDICESARRYGHKDVHFVPKGDIIAHLKDVVRPGDAVFILGAGDIDEMPEKVVKALDFHSGNR